MERTHPRPTGRTTRSHRLIGLLGAVTLLFGGLILPSAPAEAANIAGPRRSALERLEEGDAIRRRRLLRGGRFEIAPAVGFTLNDAFQRNILFGANLGYHISDSFAIGATVFGSTSLQTGLADEVEQAEDAGLGHAHRPAADRIGSSGPGHCRNIARPGVVISSMVSRSKPPGLTTLSTLKTGVWMLMSRGKR